MKENGARQGEKGSEGGLLDGPGHSNMSGDIQEPSPPEEHETTHAFRSLGKVLIVVILALAVAAVIFARSRTEEKSSPAGLADTASAFGSASVLATVNGENITLEEIESFLNDLPPHVQASFKQAKHKLLQELITRKMLLQEAKNQKIDQTQSYREALALRMPPPGREDSLLIGVLLRTRALKDAEVAEEDLRRLYQEPKDEIPGRPESDDVKYCLRASVRHEAEYHAVHEYEAELKAKATIVLNEQWVEAQKAAGAENPLDLALKTGRPVVADFGRGTCIPCKMMKPILDDLKKEYEGRAEVLIIDIDDYPALRRQCGILTIPTQIFYDASGAEVYRHQGFMPREEIVAELAELVVE